MSLVFGDFVFDQERRQLLRLGQPVRLEPKVYELLGLLLERRPKALNKAQIRDVLWPGTFVSESALAGLVTDLRAALGDDPQQSRYIRTVRGFGYAFCAEARADGDGRPVDLDARPYPGLEPFTEADGAHFFGREAEVVALWEKVQKAPLLAVIGPSGAGKSSFLRAGVIPRRPEGWKVAYATPGSSPALSLGRALTTELAGDAQAMGEILQGVQDVVQGNDPERLLSAASRWRAKTHEALLVLDQFEELFTLNGAEAQSRFADLIGRLVEEGGWHVVLSLRDDFLFRCHSLPPLVPVFRDLTPLGPPSNEALRRALEEPAARLGVRFDDGLVDEMTQAVAAERGALPLLAFAMSRLWEERDREARRITRKAYERIGGVAGALAQHAEATLGGIGPNREPIVRELFRNLGTAAGTRAARERDDLLSVFDANRADAEPVLDALVGARLLTEYDAPDGAMAPGGPRIEIVHESLLTHWPRLTRWLAQDAEGALLRDQLRQAAKLWDEKGRKEGLLWTGRAYREYALWREHYPGALGATEEAFAQEAARLADRSRRRKGMAVAAVVAAALAVATGAVGLWRRAEHARRHAAAEALRAEGSKLLALGQLQLEKYPTAAVAYALASLELADTVEARLLALRALQRGPIALIAPAGQRDGLEAVSPAFSPGGEWLALGGFTKISVMPRDGADPLFLGDYTSAGLGDSVQVGFGPEGRVLATSHNGDVRVWALPSGAQVWAASPAIGQTALFPRGDHFFTSTSAGTKEVVRRWMFSGGSQAIGELESQRSTCVDVNDTWYAYPKGRRALGRGLLSWTGTPRVFAEPAADVQCLALQPDGGQIAVQDKSGSLEIWPIDASTRPVHRAFRSEGTTGLAYDASARWLAAYGTPNGVPTSRLWDLTAPPGADPLVLTRPDVDSQVGIAFDPSGRWLVTANIKDAALWPLGHRYPWVMGGSEAIAHVAYTQDSAALVSLSTDGVVRLWPLSPGGEPGRIILRDPTLHASDGRFALDRETRRIAISAEGGVVVVPLAGGPRRHLTGFSDDAFVSTVAFSPDGRRVAAAPLAGPAVEKVVRIWDLESGAVQVLGPVPGASDGFTSGMYGLTFVDEKRLLVGAMEVGVVVFDLERGLARVLAPKPDVLGAVSPNGDFGVGAHLVSRAPRTFRAFRVGLEKGDVAPLEAHGELGAGNMVALNPAATLLATTSVDGTIHIGPVSGGEPHYLFGHEGLVTTLAFSPDGRWLASGGYDKKIRLWPVPEISERPFHMLPRGELLGKLRALTNLRAIPDPASGTGYSLKYGPFPGWAGVPEW